MAFRNYFIILILLVIGLGCRQKSNSASKQAHPILWDKYYLGSSYYPEQWDSTEWEEDFLKMEKLGLNTVRMGEFAWYFFEPSEDSYHFDWMDKAIELAAKHGIKTILATPTASVPAWLYEKHPDVLGGNRAGKYSYGVRRNVCLNSPSYIKSVNKIVEALAHHYCTNPNVIGWQIDNELGGPFECFDKNCEKAFQQWLKNKYQNADSMSKYWGGAMWSIWYNKFEQVKMPQNSLSNNWGPGTNHDYRLFFSNSCNTFIKLQTSIIKRYNKFQFVTTNYPNLTWSIDASKSELDCPSWDNYAQTPGLSDYREQYYSFFNHDFCRSLGKNQHFLIAEQTTQVPPHARQEGIRLQVYINLAHGAYGNIFFEFKTPIAGMEQGYQSIIELDGSYNLAYNQFLKFGKELKRIGVELAGAQTKANIAFYYSYPNSWQKGVWSGENGYDYDVNRYYCFLRKFQTNIDVITLTSDLKKYKLIVAPNLRIVTKNEEEAFKQFVNDGGCLIINTQSGTRDSLNRYLRSLAPGPLSEMAGIRIKSRASKEAVAGQLLYGLSDQKINKGFGIKMDNDSAIFQPYSILEDIELNGAKVIAKFKGGQMEGKPAVTVNNFGKGQLVYVGSDPVNLDFYEKLADLVIPFLAIHPILEVPIGVAVTERTKNGKRYIFVLNLMEKEQNIRLQKKYFELITQQEVSGNILLKPFDVLILSDQM